MTDNGEQPPAARRTALAVVLGVSAAPFDSAVNIAFPAITGAFQRPMADIQWVIVAYVLTYASLVLGAGRLGDVVGHRRVFGAGIVISVAGLLACAMAAQFEALVAARVVQGLGSALLLGAGPALITLVYPDSERVRVVGLYTLCFGLAGALGPALGGMLVAASGWPGVFWFRLPVLLLALGVLATTRTASPPGGDTGVRPGFDPRASIALVVTLVCALLAVGRGTALGWSAPATLTLLTTAVLAGTLYVVCERRRPDMALFGLHMLGRARFTVTNLTHVLVSLAHFSVLLLVPYFLARQLDGSIALAGLVLAADPAGVMLASAIIGRWLRTGVSDRLALLAVATVALGLAAVACWPADVPLAVMLATLLAAGFGFGFYQVTAMDRIMAALPRNRRGVAGAMNMLTRTIGVVSAAAIGPALFAAAGGERPDGFQAAFSFTLACAAALAAAALLVLAGGQWLARRQERAGDSAGA